MAPRARTTLRGLAGPPAGVGLLFLICQMPAAASGDFSLEITEVAPNVYSAIGETQPPTYENRGHNNNLSFIVTDDGVLVVNGGDNYYLARALHRAIRNRTQQPVRWVVDENGQGHAFLGNSYWLEQDVPVIALQPACEEIRKHGQSVLKRMRARNRERGDHTSVVVPQICFRSRLTLHAGSTTIELLTFGPAHSPGDLSVWLPEEKILIAGDIAFHQRLLAIFPETDVSGWLSSFEKMMALQPAIVVPGHGGPTDVQTVKTWTYDYLTYLSAEVQRILDDFGDLSDAYDIDQSAYSSLDTFDELARKNAGRLFQQMEMDSF